VFVRKNTKLLTRYPKAMFQAAMNEPDSSVISEAMARQMDEIKQPCLKLTQKSQQTEVPTQIVASSYRVKPV
jgi:hypothetical protein